MPPVTPKRNAFAYGLSKLLWIVVCIAVLPATVCIVDAFFATAAPGQAAAAAFACAFVVVPYVLARAWDELSRPE